MLVLYGSSTKGGVVHYIDLADICVCHGRYLLHVGLKVVG